MKFAIFIPLVGCICNLLLALTVLRSSFRIFAHRVYLGLCLCIAIWNIGQYFLFVAPDANSGLFWARFCWFGVIFIPVLLFHLSLLIAQVPVGRYIRMFYGLCVLLAVSDFTDYFLMGIRPLGSSGWYAKAGLGVYIFALVPFNLVFVSLFILIRKRINLPAIHRTRLDALIFGQSLLVLLGMNDILPVLGPEHYPFTHITIYPYGALAAAFYGLITGYSVLHHQLLDVHVALGRIAAQIVRFTFLFFIGLILLLTATLFAPMQFTPFSFFSALAVLMISGAIASIYFPRLFGSGAEALEKRILGDRFEYHDQIRSFIGSMQWYSDTNQLLSDLHDLLLKTIGVRHYQIILLDDTSRAFSLFRSYPEQPVRQIPEVKSDSAIFRFFENKQNEYLAFNTAYATPGALKLEREARIQLLKFESEFCFPFFFEDEPFGLLLIGEKTNGLPYTITDLDLLVALTKNLSVIINQIRLKNQIQQAQEIELLGRMSHGMAHDLNNLLTPISTFLQLSSEGVTLQDLNEDLLPVSLRNIKTMRAYIREALFFSQNMRPDFQMGRLDVVVAQTVDIVRSKTEKSVDILVSNSGEILVEMDEVLIQRLLANIISNAVDASRLGSSIYIEIQRISKTEHGNEWLRVRVVDSGEGIRPEDLSKVFTPYFTTKNRGDHERGFGLGLAICRRIVHLHNGNLNITSQLGKGTTVQIDLPSRQIKTPTPVTTNEQK
jgi:signal transduction histidine kinase